MTKITANSRIERWLRFLLAGAANTALSYSIYLLLINAIAYQAAYSIAYLSGIASAYCLNSIFVFRTPLSWKGLLAYPSVYIIQYLASALILGGLVELIGVNESLAPLFVIATMLPLTYLASKYILTWTSSRKG